MNPDTGDYILDSLREEDDELAKDIHSSIYTVDLLMNMTDKDVQYLLRDFDNSELAVIIKGKREEIRERILCNISERRRLMIEEESVFLGEMRRADVDKSTAELIEYLKELEQKGEVSVPRGEGRMDLEQLIDGRIGDGLVKMGEMTEEQVTAGADAAEGRRFAPVWRDRR